MQNFYATTNIMLVSVLQAFFGTHRLVQGVYKDGIGRAINFGDFYGKTLGKNWSGEKKILRTGDRDFRPVLTRHPLYNYIRL